MRAREALFPRLMPPLWEKLRSLWITVKLFKTPLSYPQDVHNPGGNYRDVVWTGKSAGSSVSYRKRVAVIIPPRINPRPSSVNPLWVSPPGTSFV